MKKIFTLIAALTLSVGLFAQAGETELFVPANASFDSSWGEYENPECTWNAATGTFTVIIKEQGDWQWANRASLNTGITTLSLDKEYQVSFDIVASTADCGGVTFKAFDDNQIALANQNIAVTNVVQTWTSEWTKPSAEATNGLIVWDFGWDPAQTVTITNISIKERDAPVPATLDSLVIKGKATKMEYEVGEAFDPAGLEVWGIYTKTVKHDSISQIKSGITWTLDPETFEDEDASDNASVTMVASYNDLTTADTTITGIKVNAEVPTPAPYLMVGKKLTVNERKDSELVYFQYFTYKNDERINGIAGTNPTISFDLYDTEGYAEINYTNKDDVERNFIVNPKIENAVDSIYQGETYLFADTLLTTAGTYQRTIESNTMTLTLKVKQKPVKYTTYENWQIKYAGSEWENMTKVGEGLFKLADINWTGSGFNVKSDDNPIKKDWYDVDDPDVVIGEGLVPPLDNVDIYLRVIDDETLKIGFGEVPPVPASGPTVDETGITVNGRKYGFPVRLVKEVK